MARTSRRLPSNADGPVFVDDTCIDCGTCRWMAPRVFDRLGSHSRVHTQPTQEGREAALRALIACPTNSIGSTDKRGIREVSRSFPVPFDGPVHHCGFHAPASFGATSWLILRPEGHILVDSPRFAAPLVRALEQVGPIRWMVLTHRDDVADHARFREHFGCTRVIHVDDLGPDTHDVEMSIRDTTELAPGVVLHPTPGHTAGSACLQVDETWLFTGDTLAGTDDGQQLQVFRDACWHDGTQLEQSVRALADLRFEWVLPGHGAPFHTSHAQMAAAVLQAVA